MINRACRVLELLRQAASIRAEVGVMVSSDFRYTYEWRYKQHRFVHEVERTTLQFADLNELAVSLSALWESQFRDLEV